jgi:hypothetical protein
MGFVGTLLISFFGFVFVVILGGRYLDYLKAEKAKEFFSNFFAWSFMIYVGVGSFYISDGSFLAFMWGIVFHGLTGLWMMAFQPVEAVLLLLHVNEPSAIPNLFIEGPYAYFTSWRS